jgi:hypothetical protein
MKSSAFPMKVQLEIMTSTNHWEIMVEFLVKNKDQLNDKMQLIRSMYAIDKKTYRIIFLVNSKVNDYMV